MESEGLHHKQLSYIRKVNQKSFRPLLIIRNYKLRKSILKIDVGQLLERVSGIGFNNSHKLTLIKLNGADKFLSLQKRRLVDQKVWTFSMDMGIFDNELTRKQILTNLQNNQAFLNKKEI